MIKHPSDENYVKVIPELKFFWEYVQFWAEADPNFPTLRYNENVITAKEFEEKSNQLANSLVKLGVKKGDRIVTILPCIPDYIIIFVACNKIGAITVPLDVRYRHNDFLMQLPMLEPKIIISLKQLEKDGSLIRYDQILTKIKNEQDGLNETLIYYLDKNMIDNYYELFNTDKKISPKLKQLMKNNEENDNTLIIWTGGTTGLPKAALLSNKNVVRMCFLEENKIRSVIDKSNNGLRTKLLANLPVSHVGGTVEIIGVGVVGGHEIIFHDKWSVTQTLETLQNEQIGFYLGAPTMYRLMMLNESFDTYDLSNLKLVLISGEIVNDEFMELLQKNFCKTIINGYGSTEIGPELTFTESEDDYSKISHGYVGKPFHGMDVITRNFEGIDCKIEEIGEVLVKGDLVCKGYFNNPEATKSAFTSDGYFKSGDLGKFDNNDGLWLTGRIKEVIRVGTYTVLPQEVEETVFNNFPLEFAAAISIPDKILGEVVWLAITPKVGNEMSEKDIIESCKELLADYKVPRKVIFYKIDPSNPPLTRIGKIDRLRIRTEVLNSINLD